jgi:hypothetical protein
MIVFRIYTHNTSPNATTKKTRLPLAIVHNTIYVEIKKMGDTTEKTTIQLRSNTTEKTIVF